MNYYHLRSLMGSKQSIPMKSPSPSFGIAPKRLEPFIEPGFRKELFQVERPSVVLISAVGATGKTTLAHVLSSDTGLPLLDLAMHKPVGDNTLTGLLTSAFDVSQLTSVFHGLASGAFGIIVDGLDEGRSKTTEKAFHAFLDDVARLTASGPHATFVLLGRTNTLEETWLYLEEKGVTVGLLSIEPFSIESARRYIDAFSDGMLSPYCRQYLAVRDFILDRLGAAFGADSRQPSAEFLTFIGYPPVLDAIATLLEEERDYHGLLQALRNATGGNAEVQLLGRIADHILRREKGSKVLPNILAPLIADQPAAARIEASAVAFEPVEQCARLVALLLGRELALMTFKLPLLNEKYERQLTPWLQEHPFLAGRGFRNVVFESYAVATLIASRNQQFASLVADYFRTHKYSYHIVYLLELLAPRAPVPLSLVHVLLGAAREFRGISSFVEVSVAGPDPDDYVPGTAAFLDVEIDLSFDGGDETRKVFSFSSPVQGDDELLLGSRLSSTFVRLPCGVRFEEGGELELTAPIEITAARIVLPGRTLVLRPTPHSKDKSTIIWDCNEVDSCLESIATNGVDFVLSVPETTGLTYPLIQYSETRSRAVADPLIREKALRARRILVEFRAHGRGSLARYRPKIENDRVLRNDSGRYVLQAFLRDGVLSLEGSFYFLHPEKVDEYLGISWVALRNRHTSEKLLQYLRAI